MATVSYETCPSSAPFFGFMGVTAALCFASKYHDFVLRISGHTAALAMTANLFLASPTNDFFSYSPL